MAASGPRNQPRQTRLAAWTAAWYRQGTASLRDGRHPHGQHRPDGHRHHGRLPARHPGRRCGRARPARNAGHRLCHGKAPGQGTNGGLPLPGVVVQPSAAAPASRKSGMGRWHWKTCSSIPACCRAKWPELVRIGDLVSFAQPPVELSGETLSGHSLDNRASVAALTVCLEELQSRPHAWDVWAVATSQEEVGAHRSGRFGLRIAPDHRHRGGCDLRQRSRRFRLEHLPAWQRPDHRHGAEHAPGFAQGHERTGRPARNPLCPGIYSHPLRHGRHGPPRWRRRASRRW